MESLNKFSRIIELNSTTIESTVNELLNRLNEPHQKGTKTPVCILQELCTKCLVCAPIYTIVSSEGPVHEPVFVCQVNLPGYVGIGKGTNKKKAKHNSAINVLNEVKSQCNECIPELASKFEKIINLLNDLQFDDASVNGTKSEQSIHESVDSDSSFSNPIGELIEISQKYSMRLPEFEFTDEQGPPHDRVFLCHVTFGDYQASAEGRSKKIAKRFAAINLLAKLKEAGLTVDKPSSKIKQELTEYEKSSHKKNLVSYFSNLKVSTKPTLRYLLNNENESTFGQLSSTHLMEMLSKEEGIEFKVYKVTQQTNSSSN
jgi:dsRNA-specific ribonuclease